MKPFAYVRAGSVEEATDAFAARPGARYLGGGTNLVDLMKLGVETPAALIDITRLPLDAVEPLPDGSLRVGALVRNSDLAAHPAVRDRYPALSQALLAGASGQLRNAATTGGNLLQRTRCPYFQGHLQALQQARARHRLRRPAGRPPGPRGARPLPALRRHPPLRPGGGARRAGRPGGAVRARGRPDLSAADFHRLPGTRPEQDTEIRPGELITGVLLPAATAGLPSVYRKARDRASYAFALASVAAVLHCSDGVVDRVGLAFGALAHRPWRARRAEEALLGVAPTAAAFEHAVDLELAAAEPLGENAYKVPLARTGLALDVLGRLAPVSPI
ncbi:FAD-binding molybdopterin dehydrogenase OS=Streptomyces fumanus OX=67302 GN=GCM10018772_26830 PE=4 SV=1 [Streptomyces fumanus]